MMKVMLCAVSLALTTSTATAAVSEKELKSCANIANFAKEIAQLKRGGLSREALKASLGGHDKLEALIDAAIDLSNSLTPREVSAAVMNECIIAASKGIK
jgi:hypothetical protein